MRCLIRTRTPQGAWQEQPIEADALTIGRSSQNLIELPGLLVSPLHARILVNGPDQYRIESSALAGVEVNEVVGLRAAQLASGDVVGIGEHKLRIGAPRDGYDLVLDVERGDPGSAFARAGSRTELLKAGLGQRVPAWTLALLVLLLCGVLPLAAPGLPDSARSAIGALTERQWLAGPVSPPHGHFGSDCRRCHERPFVPVQDAACLDCHGEVAHHSDNEAIRALPGLDRGCGSCHDEHNGLAQLTPRADSLCADCHASPEFADFPQLQPAGDFGSLHPAFRPLVTLREPGGGRALQKVEQVAGLQDFTALIFPHDLHLAAAGVRGPDGNEVLACASCHAPATGGVGFADVRYEPHCARCHWLDTLVAGTELVLPHGSDAAVWQMLEQIGRLDPAPAPTPIADSGRRLPGDEAPRGGPMTLDEQLADVFERRVCAKCHETERDAASGRPRVRPVQLRHSWFTHARFTHAEHEWVACDDCHAARESGASEQLLLPDLASCRTCHGGVASNERVPSTCIDCHRLHRAQSPWVPAVAVVNGVQGNVAERPRESSGDAPPR